MISLRILAAVLTCGCMSAASICEFECLAQSDSNLQLCTPIAGQFSMEVVEVGTEAVGFQFSNVGPAAVDITNFFFSDALNLVTGFLNSPWTAPGVSFGPGGPDISGALVLPAGFQQDYKAQALAGGTLGAGEKVTVEMALAGTSTAEDVRQALVSGSFQVIAATLGIGGPDRTQYLAASCCEEAPEPAAGALVGAGLAAALWRLRAMRLRRRQSVPIS